MSSSLMSWDLLAHFSEDEAYFFVYVDPEAYHLVPKRAFATREAQIAFRRLLEDRIPRGGEERVAAGSRGVWTKIAFALGVIVLRIGGLLEAVALVITS